MGIREVAELASVSTATVSRVITGTGKVSPATTEKVLNAVKVLDFRPDESARALAFQKKVKLRVWAETTRLRVDRDRHKTH